MNAYMVYYWRKSRQGLHTINDIEIQFRLGTPPTTLTPGAATAN